MEVLDRRTESEDTIMTSPIDMTELLRRLNDRDEQAMAYPAIEDYEHHIDLSATDVLHGWRDSEAYAKEELFADAFANAFRVLVLAGGQQVLRRTGQQENRWVWQHTGHIAGWTVTSYASGSKEQREVDSELPAGYYTAARERWFSTAADAVSRAREIASVAGEHCRKVRVVVCGIEVYSCDEARQTPDRAEAATRTGVAGGESG